MKKFLMFLILFLLLFSSDAFTQNEKASIGIFSGINLNSNSFEFDDEKNFMDTSYSNDTKTNFSMGVFAMYDIAKNFGIRIQGQYINKGGITKVNTYTGNNLTPIERSYRNSINYIQFSFFPQFNLPLDEKKSKSKAYINAGGYLSVKLSAKEYITYSTDYEEMSIEKDISNSIKGSDAGLIFGAGLVYGEFLIDVRYDLGLTNITEEAVLKDFLKIKNRSINISVGWTGGI
ncbi:MAG: PorT family protein [Ignavibacteria bacterium]|nr:PorT family protein [Ignavibacteria bacterium]